jgi:hypothetical protein
MIKNEEDQVEYKILDSRRPTLKRIGVPREDKWPHGIISFVNWTLWTNP